MAERAFSRRLGGSCRLPIAAYAETGAYETFELRVMLGMPDGSNNITAKAKGRWRQLEELSIQTAEAILKRGGNKIIKKLTGNTI